jgi:hypothetical protein
MHHRADSRSEILLAVHHKVACLNNEIKLDAHNDRTIRSDDNDVFMDCSCTVHSSSTIQYFDVGPFHILSHRAAVASLRNAWLVISEPRSPMGPLCLQQQALFDL